MHPVCNVILASYSLWGTKMLSALRQPATEGHNRYIDYLSVILSCHVQQQAPSTPVLQAVDILLGAGCV